MDLNSILYYKNKVLTLEQGGYSEKGYGIEVVFLPLNNTIIGNHKYHNDVSTTCIIKYYKYIRVNSL